MHDPETTVVSVVGDTDQADIPIHRVEAAPEPAGVASLPEVFLDPSMSIGDDFTVPGMQVHKPGSSLVKILAEKGVRPITPVLPNGIQWVQAGRRHAGYRGNSVVGGIDPIAVADPSNPEWVAWVNGNRNEMTFPSLNEAMEWVMVHADNPSAMAFDLIQEHVGPINLKMAPDGYRFSVRLKGTDNLLCLYLFDDRNATSQEMRINIGMIPKHDPVGFVNDLIKGMRAGLNMYRNWKNVPGMPMPDYDPPRPEQVVDRSVVREAPALPDLDKPSDPPGPA